MASPRPWKAEPHGPLNKLEDNLWCIEGNVPGIPIKRHMTIVRLNSGELIVYNPMAVSESVMTEIEGWGTPAFMVVPNSGHRLDAHAFAERYPKIKVVCAARAQEKVREKVRVDGLIEDIPSNPNVRLEALDGNKSGETVLIVRNGAGQHTIVLCDAIYNLNEKIPGLQGFLVGLVFGGGPNIPKAIRMIGIDDKKLVKAHLLRLADTANLKRVIVAHGPNLTHSPAGTLRAVASTL